VTIGTPVVKAQYASTAKSTTHTPTWTAAGSGDLLVACVTGDAAPNTVTGWTRVNFTADFASVAMFQRVSDGTETSQAFTLALSAQCRIDILSIPGSWGTGSAAIDVSAVANVTANSVSVGPTAATANAAELIVVMFGNEQGATYSAYATGFTTDVNNVTSTGATPNVRSSTLHKVTSATGTQSASATASAAVHTSMVIAAFKESAGGTTFNQNPVDAVGVGDTLTKTVGKTKVDSVGVGDTLSKSVGKTTADSVGVGDTLAKTVGKATVDSVGVADALTKSVWEVYCRCCWGG
jgi:hypothetical protein